ncbi:lysylphosphatidylglycerol synthase transmembrane domain-containing protein [Flavitalea sp.]|nr:lysylphosphatidylglycerol synthase transmembrane domain-containing protein [Flavitalea sp.]
MKKKLQSLIQYIFFLGFGVFLVWWSLRKIDSNDWADIKQSFENANYWMVVPVIFTLLLSHLSRAMRWKILMEPLGYKPKLSNTYMAVLIGYMANLALPRLGEVLKCTILARYEKVPADKLIGTIVAERAFDVVCLIVIIAVTVLVQVDLIGEYMSTLLGSILSSKTSSFTTGKLFLVIGIVVIVIASIWLVFRKLSHIGFVKKIKLVLKGIWSGVISVRYLKNKRWFIFHSIFIWVMFLLSVQIGLWAFKETSGYGIKEALSVLTTGSLAMIIPTPGGIGVYPIFVQQTMLLYGLKESIGFAFGSLLWGVQFFQMLLSGFVALLVLPYLNKKTRYEKS